MVHEENVQVAGPRVKLTCRECRKTTAGLVLRRERRPFYFFIPLGVDRQVLVRCNECGTEFFAPTLPLDTVEGCDVDRFLGKVNSPLFPKMLVVFMLVTLWLP